MTLLIVAGVCLVLAQALGLYALKARTADVIFSLVMLGLLVTAVVLGALGVYQKVS